ncbi:hypothetical protein GCM10007874_60400 [Labrys miyagiensis]|uniref:MaoC family dehydratase n=2 Tax=Labrys miyagiensis TaxID=346912 RepID=A0ABQ6CVK2_9HYPH|nr:hypothetical protein GCM10007874_60400 [Labrys miyagiensis]
MPHLRIGPVEARVEADAVGRYRAATAIDELDAAPADEVPATFPAVWLWHPAARAAFDDLTGDDSLIPVLIAQRFCYRRTLRIGDDVRFFITRRADPSAPEDVQIEAHVEDLNGAVIADFSATYRLFGPEAAL